MIVWMCENIFLLVPRRECKFCIVRKFHKLFSMIKNAFPKSINRSTDIIYINVGYILMKKQFKSNAGTSSVRFNVLTIDQIIVFNNRLHKGCKLCLPTRIPKRGVVK